MTDDDLPLWDMFCGFPDLVDPEFAAPPCLDYSAASMVAGLDVGYRVGLDLPRAIHEFHMAPVERLVWASPACAPDPVLPAREPDPVVFRMVSPRDAALYAQHLEQLRKLGYIDTIPED